MDITIKKYVTNMSGATTKQETYLVSFDEGRVNSMTPDELSNALISQINSDPALREIVVAKKVNKPVKKLKFKFLRDGR